MPAPAIPSSRGFYLRCKKSELHDFYRVRTGTRYPERPAKDAVVRALLQLDRDRTFPFFQLPPELRLMVYEFLVVRRPFAETLTESKWPKDRFIYLKPMAVCSKQAHEDVYSFIYPRANFTMASSWSTCRPFCTWAATKRSWYTEWLQSYLISLNNSTKGRFMPRETFLARPDLMMTLGMLSKIQNITILIEMYRGKMDDPNVFFRPYSPRMSVDLLSFTLNGLFECGKSLRSIAVVVSASDQVELAEMTHFLLHSIPIYPPRITLKLRGCPKVVENVF